MKRILVAALIVFVLMSLAGCDGNSAQDIEARRIINLKKLYKCVDIGVTSNHVDIYYDVKTRVIYVGLRGHGMMPVYNPDGTLKLWKEGDFE